MMATRPWCRGGFAAVAPTALGATAASRNAAVANPGERVHGSDPDTTSDLVGGIREGFAVIGPDFFG